MGSAPCGEGKIWEDPKPQLARRTYELEIARRLLNKATDEAARQTCETQVDLQEMLVGVIEGDLAEQREELALCERPVVHLRPSRRIQVVTRTASQDEKWWLIAPPRASVAAGD